VSSTPATSPPDAAADRQRRRDRRGLIGLVVMVAAILLFTAVSVAIELASNRGKSFKGTVEVLGPVPGGANNEVRLRFQVTNTGTRSGRPDKCEAILYDLRGERAGVAEISLRQPIAPGQTHLEEAIGTAAGPPINGRVQCRGLEPG
jgi:hypothetical protein